jgi:hypothetical protein
MNGQKKWNNEQFFLAWMVPVLNYSVKQNKTEHNKLADRKKEDASMQTHIKHKQTICTTITKMNSTVRMFVYGYVG